MESNIDKQALSEVLVSETSTVFHLKAVNHIQNRLRNKPLCAMRNVAAARGQKRVENIEDVADTSMRHCKDCVELAYSVYDIPVCDCYLCEDLSLLNDKDYVHLTRENTDRVSNTLHLCSSCIDSINKKLNTK